MIDEMPIIFTYSRAQAIKDGVLIDVSTMAKEAGFKCPVALTAALWHDIETIPGNVPWQDVNGRLWDVLWMAYCVIIRDRIGGSHLRYSLILHTNENDTPFDDNPPEYFVHLACGPGDNGEPVITLMKPDED